MYTSVNTPSVVLRIQQRCKHRLSLYAESMLERYPPAFRDRVRDACLLFKSGATPRRVRQEHGVFVMDAAIEFQAALNGYTGPHRTLHEEVEPCNVVYPIFKHRDSSTLETVSSMRAVESIPVHRGRVSAE